MRRSIWISNNHCHMEEDNIILFLGCLVKHKYKTHKSAGYRNLEGTLAIVQSAFSSFDSTYCFRQLRYCKREIINGGGKKLYDWCQYMLKEGWYSENKLEGLLSKRKIFLYTENDDIRDMWWSKGLYGVVKYLTNNQ